MSDRDLGRDAAAPRRPGARRRNLDTKAAILAATYELLQEQGFDRLTIEGAAARAGIGKATVYRWWASKGALAVEAFLTHVTPVIEFRSTGCARQDISRQMRRLAEAYSGPTGTVVREMIASSQFDPEALRLFNEGYLEPRRADARTILEQGIKRGEFRADLDPDIVIDGLYAPIYYRLLVGKPLTDENFLATIEGPVLDSISVLPHGEANRRKRLVLG